MRGMDPAVAETGFGEHCDIPVYYAPTASALGVVLEQLTGRQLDLDPVARARRPGRAQAGPRGAPDAMRIMQALIAARLREAFSFYPTDHEGSSVILTGGRVLLFGDEAVTKAWSHDARANPRPRPQQGDRRPGRRRRLAVLPVLAASVADNGGRSASTRRRSSCRARARSPRRSRKSSRRASRCPLTTIKPCSRPSPTASSLSSSTPRSTRTSPAAAPRTADSTETAPTRRRPYPLPTVVHCDSVEHPLARTEFPFPFTSVVEVSPRPRLRHGAQPRRDGDHQDAQLIDALLRPTTWIASTSARCRRRTSSGTSHTRATCSSSSTSAARSSARSTGR